MSSVATRGDAPPGIRGTARWVLLLTALACVLNYFDRYLLVIMTEPIRQDLGLSDTQMGSLSGLAFALIYCIVSIPISHLADRGQRVSILAGSLGLWSVMTALCGATTGFVSLAATRMGVAVGEAGGLPTVHALVAEHFPASARARALSIISSAGVIGLMLAMVLGGLLNDWLGWRRAFMIAAAPGIILALLVRFTLREPANWLVRRQPMREGIRTLCKRRAYVWLLAGLAVAAIGSFGAQAWGPALLMRTHQVSAGRVGLTYALVSTSAMLVGTLAGGWLADRLAMRNPRWPYHLLAGSFILSLPFYLAFLYAPTLAMALVWCAPALFFSSIYISVSYAQVQSLAGPGLRATAAAVYITAINLLGLGMGPTLAGVISDLIGDGSARGLAHSLAILLAISFPVASALLLIATRTIGADLEDADRSA